MDYDMFRQLPPTCAELIEGLEIILTGEMLIEEGQFEHMCRVQKASDGWIVYLLFANKALSFININVPRSIGPYTPAFVELEKFRFTEIDVKAFIKEIKDRGIVAVEKNNYRGMGYTTMGGYGQKPKEGWQFYFPQQKTIYDFYLIGKKYNLF